MPSSERDSPFVYIAERAARARKKVKVRIRRFRRRLDPRPVAHFLHIGKTAGTALRVPLRDVQKITKFRMVLHGHDARLEDIPDGDKFFFCVRDPLDRYVSAFLHRQLEGRPRFVAPWSAGEAVAFSRFSSPDELAVALSAGGERQLQAEEAMRTIHLLDPFSSHWFTDARYFRSRSDDLLWIGRQESLDLGSLATALGVDTLTMPEDPTLANRSPTPKPELSDLARQNLTRWYAKDYEFLQICDELFPLPRR
jgi:hypothetical protein